MYIMKIIIYKSLIFYLKIEILFAIIFPSVGFNINKYTPGEKPVTFMPSFSCNIPMPCFFHLNEKWYTKIISWFTMIN